VRHELVSSFLIEAGELVEQLLETLLTLERGDAEPDAVASLFRQAHTLKGAANVVGQTAIADVAHVMEDALAAHQVSRDPLSPQEIGEFLRLLDAIEAELRAMSAPRKAAGPSERAPADELEAVRIGVGDLDELARRVLQAEMQLAGMRASLAQLGPAQGHAAAPEAATQHAAHSGRSAADAGRRARASLAAKLDAVESDFQQVREHVEALRLVPAGAVFPALARAARDAGHVLDRAVRFDAAGGHVRLDRHVLSAVRDGLVHMVRNAVDHGIEPAEDRALTGKPASGRVALRVARRGGTAVFTCEDDGRGIDADAVRRAAVSRGLMSAEDLVGLPDDAVIQLVFRAGLTTARDVTGLSGRGVGLDVVASAVARLGGQVSASSRAGLGASIELCVPISLASISALALESRAGTVLVPLDAIVAIARVSDCEIARVPEGEAVFRDGKAFPIVSLERLLARDAPARRADQALVLLRASERGVALAVERLGSTMDVVVHAVPRFASAAAWVGGAALDYEGNPVLLLDPAALLDAARTGAESAPPGEAPLEAAPLILVVDDSLTTRTLEQSILEGAGYEVELACSAEEALAKAAARRYGVFVVDVEMPGMSGFEFTEKTRADPDLRSVPVILVTSLFSTADKQRGRDAGAAAYFVKSEFDQQRFLERIAELVGGPRG